MSIKELINKHYKNGFDYNVSQDELNEFVREYLLINELKDDYNEGIVNRKEVGNEILTRGEDLKRLMNIFEQSIFKGKYDYEYPDTISDCNKVFDLLLKLSNESNNKYILKKFCASDFGSFEKKHGDREFGMLDGEIWVVGKKEVLDCIDSAKPYYGSEFGILSTELVNDGHSMVMLTNHYYENNVMPYSFAINSSFHKFSVKGLMNDLCCYTYDDELGEAVNKLKEYIDVYGGNVDNISINTLILRIEELHNMKENNIQKGLIKTIKQY